MPYNMIDLSSNNHPTGHVINFREVMNAINHGVVMVKASEGLHYKNPYFAGDVMGTRNHRAHRVGAYHFARPAQSAASEQAAYFQQTISDVHLMVDTFALDLEVDEQLGWTALDQWATDFLNALVGRQTRVLYTSDSWASNLPSAPDMWPLWCASWGRRPRRQMWAWQAGSTDLPGISGPVDVGYYYG